MRLRTLVMFVDSRYTSALALIGLNEYSHEINTHPKKVFKTHKKPTMKAPCNQATTACWVSNKTTTTTTPRLSN